MGYEKTAQFYDDFDSKGNVDFYLDLARRTPGNVLELGVGTGRVLFEIAKLGRDVVGIDNSEAMLREAKRKRRKVCPDVRGRCRLILADMLSFDLGETFGFVYSASAGVQGANADDLRGTFRSAAGHLADHGIFAFDVAAPAAMRETKVFPPERREFEGGRVLMRFIAQTYNEATDTVSYDLTFKEHVPGRTSALTINERSEAAVVTPAAIEDALGYAGLKLHSMHGDFEGSPYETDSKWIVVVAGRDA